MAISSPEQIRRFLDVLLCKDYIQILECTQHACHMCLLVYLLELPIIFAEFFFKQDGGFVLRDRSVRDWDSREHQVFPADLKTGW